MSRYIPSRPYLPNNLLEKLRICLINRNTFLKSESVVVFVCGARPHKDFHSGRESLMQYAQKHLSKFNFFMAEQFFLFFIINLIMISLQ